MIYKPKKPYIRDVFQASLVKGAARTTPDGYPIIEKWMVAKSVPEDIFQWDRRYDVDEPGKVAMSFYCNDSGFIPILNNPQKYVEKLKIYQSVIGIDPSPYDNMPLVVQKSQIFNNLAITYYFGKQGIKIIPNLRIGNDLTIGAVDAFPKETLIGIGTNGFIKSMENRKIFRNQVSVAIDIIRPSGILVYGPVMEYIFEMPIKLGIPIYQYDSYTMKQNKLDKERKNKIEGL